MSEILPYKSGQLLKLLSAIALLCAVTGTGPTYAQNSCHLFNETAKTVCGRFLDYWVQQGGVQQQGFAISNEMQERSDTDGKSYTVQYFERAVFELHTENQPPYDVLLSLLGVFEYKRYYGPSGALNQKANMDNAVLFSQTGKTLGGRFRIYWEEHGGLAQQGYPISDEFLEQSRLDGKSYTVQYFERAVFELHTENQPPYDVLLSQLGTFRYQYKTYKQDPEDCLRVHKQSGPIIAEGTNSTPSSRYRVKSYRVEDIVLPGPITCTVFVPDPVHGEYHTPTLTFDKVWHFIITADRIFYPNEMRWEVFLDGVLLGRGLPSSPGEITVTVYDKTMLREGATIGVSYDDTAKPEYTLPEKLHFNRAP